MEKKELSQAGREQLAMALVLLKDWKCAGRFDAEVTILVRELAEHIGVLAEYEQLLSKIPPMRVEPR